MKTESYLLILISFFVALGIFTFWLWGDRAEYIDKLAWYETKIQKRDDAIGRLKDRVTKIDNERRVPNWVSEELAKLCGNAVWTGSENGLLLISTGEWNAFVNKLHNEGMAHLEWNSEIEQLDIVSHEVTND